MLRCAPPALRSQRSCRIVARRTMKGSGQLGALLPYRGARAMLSDFSPSALLQRSTRSISGLCRLARVSSARRLRCRRPCRQQRRKRSSCPSTLVTCVNYGATRRGPTRCLSRKSAPTIESRSLSAACRWRPNSRPSTCVECSGHFAEPRDRQVSDSVSTAHGTRLCRCHPCQLSVLARHACFAVI